MRTVSFCGLLCRHTSSTSSSVRVARMALPTPVQYSGLRSPTRLDIRMGPLSVLYMYTISCASRMTRCTASPVRWARRSRCTLATLITSMLLTMPEEISNIFKVRRYLPVSPSCAAYPRLTRLPNRRWVVLLAR